MNFHQKVLFFILIFPIVLLSQEIKKGANLSLEKRASGKMAELINENAEDAFKYGAGAVDEIESISDSLSFSNLLRITGVAAFNLGKYEQALSYYYKAALISEKINSLKAYSGSLRNIANVFYMIDQYEDAIYYNKKCLSIYNQLDSVDQKIANTFNVLGLIYSETDRKDSAILYYEKALDLYDEKDVNRAVVYGNIGLLKEESNEFDEALEFHFKAKALREKYEDYYGLAWTLNHIGIVYNEQNKYVQARSSLRQALTYAIQLGLLNEQKDINESLFHAFLGEGQADSAAYYFSEYRTLDDSIKAERLNKNIQEMEAKYQVEKKEAALALSNEKSARLSAENQTNKLYLSGAVVLLILLAGGFLVVNRSFQQKRKIASMQLDMKSNELNEMMSQQEAASLSAMLKGQEEERERIAKDLHDRLGGTLAALKLGMRRPENKVEKEELDMLDGAVVEVRNIAHNLSAGVMEKAGLRVALMELKKMIERSGAIQFDVFVQSNLSEIGQEAALELYRIVQELTNNTIKHANATSISVQATMTKANFNLIFEDNGDGFTQNEISEGMGMRNMRARAEKINGSFHLDSSPGRGTIAIIEIEKST